MWFTLIANLVGQATKPVQLPQYGAPVQQTDPVVIIGAVAGVAVVGYLVYLAVK